MAASAYFDTVQKLYIAFYQRPADSEGLAYWADRLDKTSGDSSAIIDAFATSLEARTLYGPINSGNIGTVIDSIYMGLFGRHVDAEGLGYYTDGFLDGTFTAGSITLNILNGARNEDQSIIDNKLQVAKQFTALYDSYEFTYNEFSVQRVRDMLHEVTADTDPQDFNGVEYLLAHPGGGVFTLTENVVITPAVLANFEPTVKTVTYIGFNPHANGETGVDNLDGNNPDGNDNNLTNENVADGGVPLYDLDADFNPTTDPTKVVQKGFFSYIRDLTGLDFVQLGLIDVANGVNDESAQLPDLGGQVTITQNGDNSTATVTVTAADGTIHTAEVDINNTYFKLLTNLVFDEESNLRLFEKEIKTYPQIQVTHDANGNQLTEPYNVNVYQYVSEAGTETIVPIILTPTVNNGGSRTDAGEYANPTRDNDLIVAGRLELLHQAYIDAGAGEDNTLEVDAKGYYAQPAELLNIQHIKVHNLPNVYTTTDSEGNPVSTYPDLSTDPAFQNSVFDITRAVDLQTLTITESHFDGLESPHSSTPGSLTVAGIRNGAVTTLDGSFTQNLYLHYGELQGAGVNLVFNNLNFGGSGGYEGAQLVVAHNSNTLNIESTGGGNYIANGNLGAVNGYPSGDGALSTLNITGDASLYIEGDLDYSFHDGQPALIDATLNTGGVNLKLSGSNNVTFKGSQGNDIFYVNTSDVDPSLDAHNYQTVDILGGVGNNRYVVETDDGADNLDNRVTISNADGNNDYEVMAALAQITAGNGNNRLTLTAVQSNIHLGNGNNTINVDSGPDVLSDTSFAPETYTDYPKQIDITVGDGANLMNLYMGDGDSEAGSYEGTGINVTAGNGGNTIKAEAGTIHITTGTGNDTISVLGAAIDITSAGGHEDITVVGFSDDYTHNTNDNDGSYSDGAVLHVQTGMGANDSATINLGSSAYYDNADDYFPYQDGGDTFTAMEGSSISGANITLKINTLADIRALDISNADITRVVLDDDAYESAAQDQANDIIDPNTGRPVNINVDRAMLTLTAEQFKAIGAAAFQVDGAIFNTHAYVKIIVDHTTSLTDLGVDTLPRNIDLLLEVQDGVTLTMTAEQLHTKVAPEGVTLAHDGNTDYAAGKVIINGGGLDFDPFNTSDTVRTNIDGNKYYGGSLSPEDFKVGGSWYNVTVHSLVNGYDRPADVPAEVVITLDSGTGVGSIDQGAFSSWHTNLEIVGEKDINFTGAIQLGMDKGEPTNPFNIDFSQLDATAIGLTVDNFELLGQGGGIYGNADKGYPTEVFVQLAKDATDDGIGFDESDAKSLVSKGVSKYTVTVIDGPTAAGKEGSTATIKLCDTTQDLETLALRGNYNDTLNVVDAAWGLVFELQGGSTAKADGPTGTANVGKLVANYEWDHASAVVNLVHSVADDTRAIHAAGIEIDQADSISIQAGASSAIIESISGDSLNALDFHSDANITVVSPLTAAGLSSIDGSNVEGAFGIALTGAADGAGLDFLAGAGTTTLTLDDFSAGTHSSFAAADAATFKIVASGNVDLHAATLEHVDGISLGTVADLSASPLPSNSVTLSIAQVQAIGAANITLGHPGVNGTLNLTNLGNEPFSAADLGAGVALGSVSIAPGNITLDPATVLTGATVTVAKGSSLTLTADQFMALHDLDGLSTGTGVPAAIHITGLTQAHIDAGFTLGGVVNTAGSTVSLAEDVNLGATTDLNGFGVTLADGQTLGLATSTQADHLRVEGGAGSAIELLFGAIDAADTDQAIDASHFNVDVLRFQDSLVVGENVDAIFTGLLPRVEKVLYNNAVNLVDQTLTISAGTIVHGDLAFSRTEDNKELEDFTINLQGGTYVDGNIDLGVGPKDPNLVQTYLKTITINSTGTAPNPQSGATGNTITGDILAGIDQAADENELLDVTIHATQKLSIEGAIVFTAVVNADETATLTIAADSTADVTIGQLNTADDEVDALQVVHNGTGTLTLGIDSANIDVAAGNTDALSFTGTGSIVLDVTGSFDLTNDNLSAVTSLVLEQNADLTLTMAQSVAIDAGDIVLAPGATSATLNLTGLDGEPFAVANYGTGVHVNLVSLADLPVITLDPATDLTGINGLVVPEGTVLNLTAAQFQQLTNGTITGVDADGTATTDYTVNITDLHQADVAKGLDLSQITAEHTSLTLAEDVALATPSTQPTGWEGIKLNGFDIVIGGHQLSLEDIQLADAGNVIGAGSITGTGVLKITDTTGTIADHIDASGLNVGELHLPNVLVDGVNVDYMFGNLPASVLKVIYNDLGWVVGEDQTVNVTAGTTVPGLVVFNKTEADTEIQDFTLNLQGGTEISGNLDLSTAAKAVGKITSNLQSVTINSTGDTAANLLSGMVANVITGNITAQGTGVQATYTSVDNNLKQVIINADGQNFVLKGDVVFSSTGSDGNPEADEFEDGVTANDDNAATVTLTVTGSKAVTLGGVDTSDDDVDALSVVHNGTGLLSLTLDAAKIDQTTGNTDALSFTGTGHVALTTVGAIDLHDDVLTAVSSINVVEGGTLTLSLAQYNALTPAAISVVDGTDAGSTIGSATLNIVGYDGSAFDATALDSHFATVNLTLVDANVTLAAGVNLTNVDSITVQEGRTLTLTAAQFQQLQGNGSIVTVDTDGDGTTTPINVQITNLTQADVFTDANGNGTIDPNEPIFDLSGINTSGGHITVTLDQPTVNLGHYNAEGVLLSGTESVLNGAQFVLADNQTLGLASFGQANGLDVSGGVNTTVVYKFADLQTWNGNPPSSWVHIDASGYDVTTLKALAISFTDNGAPAQDNNVEFSIDNLPSSVTLVLALDPTDLGFLDPTFRKVVIEAGVTTPTNLVFNDYDPTDELRTLDLTLSGASVLNGDLSIPTRLNKDAGYGATRYFDTLTIHSTGAQGNSINGDITTQAPYGTPNTTSENNLLKVNIDAQQTLVVNGDVVFNAVTSSFSPLQSNGTANATATLTISGGAGNVAMGAVDTSDDDVDALSVVHNGTGLLSLTLDAAKIDQAPGNNDALSFTGTGHVALTTVGAIDLHDDVLTAVSSIHVVETGTLTLSLAQYNALTPAAISVVDGNGDTTIGSATLNIVGYDGSAFDATALDSHFATVNLTLVDANVTLAAGVNLTNVDSITVQEGRTLTLTAAQFQQLQGNGSIVTVDTDGDGTITPINVQITHLTQADVFTDANGNGSSDAGEAFNLSGITTDANITVTLGQPTVNLAHFNASGVQLAGSASVFDVAKTTFVLANGQTLGVANETQADGLRVNGDSLSSTVVFKYAPHTTFPGQIDASHYNVTMLKALAAGFTIGGNSNVEYSIDGLPSTVTLQLYEDPLTGLGFLDPTYRVVVIEPNITTPTGLIFNDWDTGDEVRTLSLTLQGGVVLNGDLNIPTRTDKDPLLTQQYFDQLTIHSTGAKLNTIDGNVGTVTVLPGPNTSENNLLKVNIDAQQDLAISGDIQFNSADTDNKADTATLTLTGTANVTVAHLDISEATGDLIGTLAIANNLTGTGTLTVLGGTPAITVGTNTAFETLTITGTGNTVLGIDPTNLTQNGIASATLSTIDASGSSGALTIDTMTDIDSASFRFTSGTGVTKVWLDSDTLNESVATDPGWNFDYTKAAVGSELHLGSALVFTKGDLNFKMGANGTLFIDNTEGHSTIEDVDLTAAGVFLNYTGAHAIVLGDGVHLKLTADQANGLNIVAGPNSTVDGDAGHYTSTVDIQGLDNGVVYNFGGIAPAGTITLAHDDVTVAPTTDLGTFSITLQELADHRANNLDGQTIRFNTEAQAARAIIVDESIANNNDSSTNVVWLFNSIAAPGGIDTSKYDSALGRLWFSQDLVNNEGGLVESLFTTLPSPILRVDFTTLTALNILLNSNPVNREMELVHFTNLSNLTFSDVGLAPEEHIQNLTLDMGGQVTVGNIQLDDVVAGSNVDPNSVSFNTLTINSARAVKTGDLLAAEAYVNDNDGVVEPQNQSGSPVNPNLPSTAENAPPVNLNTVGDIGVGTKNPKIDLLNVVLNTGNATVLNDGSAGQGADLSVHILKYDSEVPGSTASLVLTGANNVTMKSIDTSDVDIMGSVQDLTDFTGTLTVTGGSPAMRLDTDERLTIQTGTHTDASIAFTGASVADTGNESVTVEYLLNGVAGKLTVNDPTINFTDEAAIADAVATVIDALAGVTAGADVAGKVTVTEEDGNNFVLTRVTSAGDEGATPTLGGTIANAAGKNAVLFGTKTDGGGHPYAGITGPDLSLIDIKGDGYVNLGVLAQIDGTDDGEHAFQLLGTGTTSTLATLGAGNVDGKLVAPTQAVGSSWYFEQVGLTLTQDMKFVTGNTLALNNVALATQGDVDLTKLVDDPATVGVVEGLLIDGTSSISVAAGNSLTITLEQARALEAAGVDVTGSGTLKIVGDATDVTNVLADTFAHLQTVNVDFSGITLDTTGTAGVDADWDSQFQVALSTGAVGDDGKLVGQYVTGSPNNDVITTADNLSDTIDGKGGDDVLDGGTDTKAPLDTFDTYLVTAGSDTIRGLQGDGNVGSTDILQVSAGATATAWALNGFTATSATSNAGTANVNVGSTGSGTIIDMSQASGPVGYHINGADDTKGLDHKELLIGSAFDDVINGGNWNQSSASQVDTLMGNDGADQFVFNTSVSSAATLTVATTTQGIDREVIAITADATDNDDETLTITYHLNGVLNIALVDLTGVGVVDVTDSKAIAALVRDTLDARAGINAVLDSADPTKVVVAGDNAASLTIDSVVAGGTKDALAGAISDGTDVAQVSTLTVTGTPTAGDLYSLVATLVEGGGAAANLTAVGGDTAASIAALLSVNAPARTLGDTPFNSAAITDTVGVAPNNNVITFTDAAPDNGGFTLATDTTAAFAGSGASDNGAIDYKTADVVTDFVSGQDTISFGLAAGQQGTNYLEAATVADYATARAAADVAFNGTIQYYLTAATNLDGFPGTGQIQGQEGAGLLFVDANLDGNADLVVLLMGVTKDNFAAGDITA